MSEIKVRVFLGDKQIAPSELSDVIIRNDYVDKIVNSIVNRNGNENKIAS